MRVSLRNYRGKCPKPGLDRGGPGAPDPVLNRREGVSVVRAAFLIRVRWGRVSG